MIRSSLLPIASKCGYAVTLAERHPESSAAAERGTAFHELAADVIRGKREDKRVASMLATFPAHTKIEAEVKVRLEDIDATD